VGEVERVTVVVVHGNPETPAVWEPLVALADRMPVRAPT